MARLLTIVTLLLTVGIGNAWGATTATYTLNSNNNGKSVTTGNVTWAIASGAITTSSSNCKLTGTITVTLPTGASLTSVTITKSNTWGSGATITFATGNTTLYTFSSEGTYTLTSNKTNLEYSFTKSGTSSKNAWVKSISVTYEEAATCTTAPTVSAGSNSNVTATTATVSCSGISSLGSAGCSITSYGFVYGTTANPTISNTKVQVGTTYPTTGTSFNKDLTGLTANTTYYVRPYATNGYGTAYGTQTSFTTKELTKYTVNWYVNGTVKHTQTDVAGTSLTNIPTPTTADCDNSKVFVGWITTADYSHATTAPSGMITNTSGMTMPEGDENYYAVFATASGAGSTSKTYKFTIAASNFNTTSYAANNNEKTSTATATDGSGSTTSVKWTSYQIMKGTGDNSNNMQWQKNAGYIYNSTDLETIESVTVTSTAGTFTTYYGTSKEPTSGEQGEGNGYFKTSVGNATGYASKFEITFTKTVGSVPTYSDYTTSCTTKTTITLNPNGGTGNVSTETTEETTYTVPDCSFTRTGYEFTKWNTKADGKGTDYEPDDEITLDGTAVNLYAIWTPITYTITYELDGGTNPSSNPANYTIETATITLQDPSKTGYTFGGWYKESNFTTKVTQIAKGSTGNITLYAKWTVNKYTLTWDSNGGDPLTGNYTSGQVEYGATITPPDFPKRNGYDFTYWYDGTNMVEHNNLLKTMPDHDLTYTAQWEAVVYGISYQGLEGASNNANNPDTYTIESETITFLPPGERTGYKFTGWTPTSITKGSTGDTTVTANWTAKALVNYRTTCLPIYEVTLNPDGGTISDVEWVYNSSIGHYTKKVIEGYDVSLPVATKAGYTNTGWKTNPTTNVVSNPYTVNGNVTLIAAYDCALASVGISGTYALTVGDVFQLKATAYDSNGNELECPANATYSWERYNSVDGVWEAITDDNSDGDNAKLTFNNCQIANCGTYRCHITYGDCGAWSQGYNVHCFHLKGSFEGDWNKEYAFNHTDEEGIATLSMDLLTGQTFEFKIYDGITQYGNGGTIETSVTGWTYGTDNQSNTIFKTGADGTYIFKLDFKRLINSENILVLDVTYPPANQAEGHTIYYDNLVHKWENVYYRIGHNRNNGDGTWGWNQNQKMTLVPGTSHLYTTKTPQFDNFEAWHIANNVSWADKNSIYLVNPDGTEYDITHATEYKKFVVVEDITLTPEATGTFVNDENCTYYADVKQSGMKMHKATVIPATGGTITVSYIYHDGTEKSDFTSGDRDLAHTCLLTITATPDAGYSLRTLTVNDEPFTSGKVHTLAEDAVIKVVWEEKAIPTFAWSADSYTAALEADNTFPTLRNPNSLSPVTYESSNTGVATIDADGNITLLATGTTTIKATGAETDDYKSATATYTLTVVESNCRWVEVEIGDIEPEDEVLVTMKTTNGTYTLDHSKESSENPPAIAITVNGNEAKYNSTKHQSSVWNISGNATDGYVLYPNGSTSKWLYCTSTAYNVKVGTYGKADNNYFFTIEDNYLKNKKWNVYIGVYNFTDWRHYPANTGNAIAGQTLKFYKRECLDASKVWVEGNLTNVTCDPQLPQQLAKDGGPITLRFEAADGYALPTSVNVKMGATTLSTTSWDRGTGKLTINAPAGGFTDNVLVTVEALQVKTVTFSVGNGDIAPAEIQTEENTNITLPSLTTNLTCVKFVGWTDAVNDAAITSSNLYEAGDSYKVTQDITLKAVYAAGGGFVLVTDANDLAAGNRIVIAAAGFDVAMGADRGNNRGEVEVTKDNTDNTITTPDGIQILTLEAGTTAGTLAFNTGNGYLYAAGGTSSNHLKTTQNLDKKGSWNISISAEGIATIKSVEPTGGNARNWLRYNSTNTPHIFSCYASGQADVSIYKESITGYTTDPECEEYDITLEVIGHANGSAKINGQTATPTTSQTVTILNTKMATISDVANVAGYDVTVSKRSGNATFTDNGNGTWTVSEPASNVTIQVQYTAKQTYKVQFVTGTGGVGNFTSLDAYKGQTVTIPANYRAVGLCGEFVGWTEGARASGEKPTKLYQPGDPFTLNSNGTSLYAVYSISASCTSEFALGKSGDYEMYAIYSSKVYYATQKNGSNDYFYANTEADIETNARVKSTFRMQYDATQTAAWNEQDVYAYTIYISNGSTEYGFWHLNSVGDLDFDATEPYYWKVKSYNGGYDIYGEANGRTYRITCNGSNFNARTSADAVYFTPGGGIEYWTDIDCSDINVDVTFAWNQFESWPIGMPNANSYKGLAKCSEITEFPIALQEGWTFLGWSTKEYNALHADDLDDENNASRAYPDGSDIYKTGGNTLTLGSADITLYPVFTRYEENEPLNLVNGGEFYMYVKPGNTDVYGGVRRFYIADVNLSSGGFTSTEDCNDARPFTFIKEDAGWLIQFVDEGGKTYYLGANAAASDLTKHQTSKTYWDITEGAGNNPANAYRMMAIGQGSEDALLAKFSNGLTSATFKYYAIENLINTPNVYFDIFLGSCEDRVFSSNPINKPAITLSGEPMVTSTADQSIRARGELSISATKLAANGTITLTADNEEVYFATDKTANFSKATKKPVTPLTLKADEKGKLAMTTVYVHYKPTSTSTLGVQTANITATTGTNGQPDYATATTTAALRNLPADFVIAAKWGDNWYAMPANMDSQSSTEGWLIEVDNAANPTKAIAAPNTTKYGLKSVYTSNSTADRYADNGERLVFVENVTEATPITKTLYNGGDGSSSKTNIQVYAQYANYYSDQNQAPRYEWIPTTKDLTDYTLTSGAILTDDAVGRTVSLDNHGIFGTLLQDKSYNGMVRLLPVDNFYEPIELQVVEWKEDGVLIMYTGPGTVATIQIGTGSVAEVPLTDARNDHAVYELTASQPLTEVTNQPLIITIKNDADAIIGAVKLTIPAIVATDKTSTELGVTEENAKATSIVVLNGATLTADATKYTYDDITVYSGGNLIIDNGKSLGMYTLTLRAGSSWGAAEYENKYPQLLVRGDYSNTSGQINLDYVTTQDYYYPLSVPEEVTIGDIKYPVEIYGSNVEKNNKGSFQLKYYDGAQRVAQGSQYGTGWKVVNENETTTLTPNKGYAIWGIPKKINGTRQTYGIHRIPIKKAAADLITNETKDENIAIIAHGDASTSPNDRGWNYLGNPYLAQLGGMDGDDEKLQMGRLIQEMIDGKWTGGWVYNGEQVRYVTLTYDCQTFDAKPVAEATIPAFTTFFIQAAQDGAILLTAPKNAEPASIAARRYAAQQETAKEITTGIILTGNDQTDRTGLLIADNFTEEYDFNADLSKFENSGINLYTIGKDGKLAYMAINQALAEQPIPVGYSAPAEGLYTIAFDEDRYNATDISALYLIDYDSNEKTNLLHTDYSFVTAAGTNNQRFALQVAFAPENATNVEWVGDATIQVGVEGNELILNNLPTDAAVHVFDALGRLMYHTPHAPTEMQLTLPTGYYLVRIADKQHAAVINTVIP